ncbi:unnamed protein product [Adineta ricciae]|nr:unnamed protein product [Adineta ricciae]
MIKLEPIEQNADYATGSRTMISTAISSPHSNKRLRKASYPMKTIKPTQLLLPNQIIHSPMEESLTSINDDLSRLDHQDKAMQNLPRLSSSKRPRLTYNKRLVANARERERVHNLTAAFEALRRVLPMYGDQEKLSRLSILRIACSYVLVLGALNEMDFSQDQNAYTLNETFHMLSYTILNELKRKKS